VSWHHSYLQYVRFESLTRRSARPSDNRIVRRLLSSPLSAGVGGCAAAAGVCEPCVDSPIPRASAPNPFRLFFVMRINKARCAAWRLVLLNDPVNQSNDRFARTRFWASSSSGSGVLNGSAFFRSSWLISLTSSPSFSESCSTEARRHNSFHRSSCSRISLTPTRSRIGTEPHQRPTINEF
jgi:hypothetical protein